jgi:hypothetical protein
METNNRSDIGLVNNVGISLEPTSCSVSRKKDFCGTIISYQLETSIPVMQT